MTEPLARVATAHRDGQVVIKLSGEIDLSNAFQLEQEIAETIADAAAMVIDLTAVEFMDSQGVRLLYHLSRRVIERGVELTVVAPADSIAGQVLRLTAMSDLVSVRESLDS
jgi:anti-sigma B factor antagonist